MFHVYVIRDIQKGEEVYKEFVSSDAAIICLGKLVKKLDMEFMPDQTLFGGHYYESDGTSWGVK